MNFAGMSQSKLARIAEIQRHALDRYGPCPDHNGKITAGDCQACRAERAEHLLANIAANLAGDLSKLSREQMLFKLECIAALVRHDSKESDT